MPRIGLLLALVACSKADAPKPDPNVTPAPDIKVELAGVTLAEDCLDGSPTRPLPPPATRTASAGSGQHGPSASMPAAKAAVAADCEGDCGGIPQPPCEQTSMQLSLQVPSSATTKIRIKQVELLDDTGAQVGILTARSPSKWDGKGTYVPWDESLAGGSLVVSYKLTSPDWNKLTNGRWNAPSKRFSLRVTVTIRDRDRTIERQSIVPTTPEPHVVT